MVEGVALQFVDKFCYLGDTISSTGGVEEAVIARIRLGWKKFRDLLPVLTGRGFSLQAKGRMYQACVRIAMLYGETWAVKECYLQRLERNDMRMIRWICNVSLKDRKPSSILGIVY